MSIYMAGVTTLAMLEGHFEWLLLKSSLIAHMCMGRL